MFSIRRFALVLTIAGTFAPFHARGEDSTINFWNRTVESLAISPSPAGAASEVKVVWSVGIGVPTPTVLNLSTDIQIRIGNFVTTKTVPVFIAPGAGACGDGNCGGSCGMGSVDGQSMSLLCLPDDGGCSCKLPPITTSVPIPSGNYGPNDLVEVKLAPSIGANPEDYVSDDVVAEPFQVPIFWDRALRSVALQPSVGATGKYDIVVEYQVAYNSKMPPQDMRTNIVMNHNGKSVVFEPSPMPWMLIPSSICGQGSANQVCAVIQSGGQIVAKLTCQPYENAWGQFACVCASELLRYTIPSVDLKPKDHFEIALVAAPGSIPELEGLDDDRQFVCGGSALSLTYGVGKAGMLGVPVLDSNAPPALGKISGVTMKEALPGAMPILLLGLKPLDLPFDGGRLLVDPAVVAIVPVPVAADGTVTLQSLIPADPSLCGVSLYLQLMFKDSGASGVHHFAMTNGVQQILGS